MKKNKLILSVLLLLPVFSVYSTDGELEMQNNPAPGQVFDGSGLSDPEAQKNLLSSDDQSERSVGKNLRSFSCFSGFCKSSVKTCARVWPTVLLATLTTASVTSLGLSLYSFFAGDDPYKISLESAVCEQGSWMDPKGASYILKGDFSDLNLTDPMNITSRQPMLNEMNFSHSIPMSSADFFSALVGSCAAFGGAVLQMGYFGASLAQGKEHRLPSLRCLNQEEERLAFLENKVNPCIDHFDALILSMESRREAENQDGFPGLQQNIANLWDAKQELHDRLQEIENGPPLKLKDLEEDVLLLNKGVKSFLKNFFITNDRLENLEQKNNISAEEVDQRIKELYPD